jgi:hypothetical protein
MEALGIKQVSTAATLAKSCLDLTAAGESTGPRIFGWAPCASVILPVIPILLFTILSIDPEGEIDRYFSHAERRETENGADSNMRFHKNRTHWEGEP